MTLSKKQTTKALIRCAGWSVPVFANPEDRFSCDEARIMNVMLNPVRWIVKEKVIFHNISPSKTNAITNEKASSF